MSSLFSESSVSGAQDHVKSMQIKRSIRIELTETAGLRRHQEPVTIGVPWPKGEAREGGCILCDEDGTNVALQSEVLQRWPGGAPQWVLFDWQMDLEPYGKKILKLVPCEAREPHRTCVLEVKESPDHWRVDGASYEVSLAQ